MVEKLKAQNSSQSKMEVQEAPSKRSPGGILKKRTTARPQLETVSEYAASQMEHKDSVLSTTESEKSVNNQPQEELEKFKILCEGVQNTLALFQSSLVELLALKDEVLQHALPPSLLVKMTLVTGKLFRSSSDLSVPITELVRMVKLYSAPWEAKSTALKKLHEDYENKQRQLNVALQKLVLVGIQSERMAQERRVMNWEKLFSKTMSSQAHGYRWKFLIDSFKKKAKNGEVYMAASTDEETERERERSMKQLEGFRRRAKHKDTAAKRIMRESLVSPNNLASSPTAAKEPEREGEQAEFDNDVVSDPEDLKMLTFEDETSSSKAQSPELTDKKPMSPPALTVRRPPSPPSKPKQGPKQTVRPRIQFLGASDDEEEEEERNDSLKVATENFLPARIVPQIRFTTSREDQKKNRPKRSGVKFLSLSDDDDDDDDDKEKEDKPVLQPKPPQVVKVDASCWTQEPEYEKFLHVRVYRPVCKKVTAPFCSIAFCGMLLKTAEFEASDASVERETKKVDSQTKEGRQRPSSRTSLNDKKADKTGTFSMSSKLRGASPAPQMPEVQEEVRFEELVFKLPDDSGHVFGKPKADISKEPLRIAVHPGTNEPMIAMATVNYEDVKILDDVKRLSSSTDASNTQQHPLTSVTSDRDMPFNSPCGHVPLLCYQTRVERPQRLVKETETATFEELLNAEIEARKEAEKASQQAVEEATQSSPVYTEEDISFLRDQHAQEVLSIQEEYEKRLNELAQGLSFTQEDESGRFVSVATSPIFLRSPTPLGSSSPDRARVPQPPPIAKSPTRKARPKIPNLPEWGKDLPDDFLVRLAMFADNSVKYHQELAEKTRRAIQQKYELQMAVQNRLTAPNGEQNEDEVCLPAVFMPTRGGHVYSPKAHSYFHPPGSSEGRLTQPPSIFKLPFLPPESQVSVLNLFEAGQKYSASAHWSLPDQSRPSTMGTPYVSQTAPPPPTACGWRSPSSPFPDRAKTR